MTNEEMVKYIAEYEAGSIHQRMVQYHKYYAGDNPDLIKRVVDRTRRNITPNWFVPTPYFSTVIDSEAGYMGQRVVYTSDDKTAEASLNDVLEANDSDVNDMKNLTYALTYNRAYELVYTTGEMTADGTFSAPEIKYTSLDPLQCIPVYNEDIQPVMETLIWKRASKIKDEFLVDVISKDLWEYFILKGDKLIEKTPERILYFPSCPAVESKAELISDQSPFHVVIPYIAALDWVITGNANENDRLVDALLVIGKLLKDDDIKHMDEWKVLDDMAKEERAEYLTKEMSPEFRKYLSNLLINEIHKHSHVVDWYNAENSSGDASAKALKIRLFDMDMYSQRIEKIYKEGAYDRVGLILHLLGIIKNIEQSPVKIEYQRTVPTDYESKMEAFKNVDWYSTQTKVIQTGGDWEVEKVRLEEETPEIDLDTIGGDSETEGS